jgi:hypothetical protein
MLTKIFRILCDIVIFLIAFIIATLSGVYRLLQDIYHHYSSRHKITYLRAIRASLLRQQEIIISQLANIDAAIIEQTQSTSLAITELNWEDNMPSTSSSEDQTQAPQFIPTRIRRRYTPLRTPEEEHRNNIIVWVNELRAKTTSKMELQNENQAPITPGHDITTSPLI